MITTQAYLKNTFASDNLFLRSTTGISYLRKNLMVERRNSTGVIHKLYKGSFLQAFWLLLTSPIK